MPGFNEEQFLRDYQGIAKELGINPNPDDPNHYYDYRGAYQKYGPRFGTGLDEASGEIHFPSEFKREGHPNRFVDGIDTKTGQPAPSSFLHPELQMIWDEVKQAVQAPIQAAGDFAQAYQEWGERNKERIPGLRAVTEATPNISEIPGIDYMFPMAGFTANTAARDIAHGLVNQGKRVSPGGAKGIRELADWLYGAFEPEATKLIRGPHPNLDPETLSSWKWIAPKVVNKGRYERIGGEDVFIPSGKTQVVEQAQIGYPYHKVHRSLELSHGGATPKQHELKAMLEQGGERAPFYSHVSGGSHEVGHDIAERIPDDVWRKMFGWPENLEMYDLFPGPGPDWLRAQAGAIRPNLQDFAVQNNLFMPRWMSDRDRVLYHLFGNPKKTGNRIFDELGADIAGLGSIWGEKALEIPSLIPAGPAGRVNLEPIFGRMRLKDIEAARRTY